jgi:hypothetical protein
MGSVEGGTLLTLNGSFPAANYTVLVGGVACTPVLKVDSATLRCTTGNRTVLEGDVDVVVTDESKQQVSLVKGFHYFCPWTWGPDAVRSCGAVPPRPAPQEHVTAMVTTASSVTTTNGDGVVAHSTEHLSAAVDFRDRMPKVWVKVDAVARAKTVELHLGSSPSDYFNFRIVAKQTQQWATEGDWVSLSMPVAHPVGHPDRAAITDIDLVVQDDGTGPVTAQTNGIGIVDEPVAKYPHGVVSLTFDDGGQTQASIAAPIMKAAGFPGTAYVIVGHVAYSKAYMTVETIRTLQDDMGWEIAAHAASNSIHASGFPAVSTPDLEKDMVTVRAWLIANGFHGYDDCAYPHGFFTGGSDVLGLARKYFTSCRTVFSTTPESVVPSDAEKLRVYLVAPTRPASSVIRAIDEAYANREWLILVFHNFTPVGKPLPTTGSYWPESDFAAVIAHLQSTGMPVKTVGDVLAN